MYNKAMICIGNYTDVVDVKEARQCDDMITILSKNGIKMETHSSNVFLWEEPEAPAEKNKGIWIINPDGWYPYCSKCGYEPERPDIHNDNRTPYCPNCGAKMRKEVEDE